MELTRGELLWQGTLSLSLPSFPFSSFLLRRTIPKTGEVLSTGVLNHPSLHKTQNTYSFITEVMAVPGTGGLGSGGGGGGGGGGGLAGDGRLLVADLRHHNFDAIRFASYRTAAKLRFVQKKTNSECVVLFIYCVVGED